MSIYSIYDNLPVINFCTEAEYPEKYRIKLIKHTVDGGFLYPMYASYRQIIEQDGYVRNKKQTGSGIYMGMINNHNDRVVLFNISQCGWDYSTHTGNVSHAREGRIAVRNYLSLIDYAIETLDGSCVG